MKKLNNKTTIELQRELVKSLNIDSFNEENTAWDSVLFDLNRVVGGVKHFKESLTEEIVYEETLEVSSYIKENLEAMKDSLMETKLGKFFEHGITPITTDVYGDEEYYATFYIEDLCIFLIDNYEELKEAGCFEKAEEPLENFLVSNWWYVGWGLMVQTVSQQLYVHFLDKYCYCDGAIKNYYYREFLRATEPLEKKIYTNSQGFTWESEEDFKVGDVVTVENNGVLTNMVIAKCERATKYEHYKEIISKGETYNSECLSLEELVEYGKVYATQYLGEVAILFKDEEDTIWCLSDDGDCIVAYKERHTSEKWYMGAEIYVDGYILNYIGLNDDEEDYKFIKKEITDTLIYREKPENTRLWQVLSRGINISPEIVNFRNKKEGMIPLNEKRENKEIKDNL